MPKRYNNFVVLVSSYWNMASVLAKKPRKIECRFANPVDLLLLKSNVLRDYPRQVSVWKERAERLLAASMPRDRCVLCGQSGHEAVGRTYGWPWHRCKSCGQVYNGRRLPPEKYAEFYRATGSPINYSDTYTDERVQRYRCEAVSVPQVDHIRRYCAAKKGRWLDIASGNGDVLAVARDKGFAVKGVEISPECVRFAKEHYKLDLFLGTLEEFGKDCREKWDVMTFLGIVDIIENPVEYFKTAYKLLNPGGIAAIRFSNFDSLSTDVQLAYPDQLVCRHLYPSVISMFTEKTAAWALEREGFEIEAIWYFGMDVYELINNLSFADSRFRDSPACVALRKTTNDLQAVIDAEKRSDQFLLIARKS